MHVRGADKSLARQLAFMAGAFAQVEAAVGGLACAEPAMPGQRWLAAFTALRDG